jgi:iron complex transport system ATP-binding protein
MIAFENVSVRYSNTHRALSGVSMLIPRGRFTAVVGPNGSGKSTLVRALLDRVSLETGRVLLDRRDVREWTRRDAARRVAVVTQREEATFPMLAREYVTMGRYPHLGPWSAITEVDPAVEDAARDAGVSELLTRRTDTLSGGEWQRLRLARAIAQQAPALVLDEPTTFLDVGHEMAAFEIIAALARGDRAVLVVSHQLNLVARFADQIVLLNRGQIVAVGDPTEVMQARILESVYEWPLVVTRDPAVGAPALLPLRRGRASGSPHSSG